MSRRSPTPGEAWGRRRLLGAVTGVLLTTVALLAGLGYAIYLTLAPAPAEKTAAAAPGTGSATGSGEHQVQQRRDAIAAEPMLPVSPQDALPAPPSTQLAPGITIPPASSRGPGGVPTGFPHTPEGAVAQLAAIETTVFQAMSMPLTADVHRHWTVPTTRTDTATLDKIPGAAGKSGAIELHLADRSRLGSPDDASPADGVAGWEIARHVQSFLGTAQMGPEKDVTTTVTATPAAGLVKGSDGPDWVLACVLLQVRAVITTEARTGFGHCERMQWHDGRWLIAPGTPPARAPSTWPGTQQSIDAGWRTWTDTNPPLVGTAPDGTAPDGTAPDGTAPDGTAPDGTGLADTGLADTGLADTGLADTGLADTGLDDTGLDGPSIEGLLPDAGEPGEG